MAWSRDQATFRGFTPWTKPVFKRLHFLTSDAHPQSTLIMALCEFVGTGGPSSGPHMQWWCVGGARETLGSVGTAVPKVAVLPSEGRGGME